MNDLKTIFDWLISANALVISTGAGMGVDSGIRTFRGKNGKWGELEDENKRSIFELSNPQMFIENPTYIWHLFAKRMIEYQNTEPHQGFQILKKWINRLNLDYFILTSNIDGHFQKAGFEELKIRELHGSLWHLQSINPKIFAGIWQNNLDLHTLEKEISQGNFPLCADNQTMARPNVYMFRDNFYLETRSKTQEIHFQNFLQNNRGKNLVVIEIGSGPHVQTIRMKTRMLMTDYQAKVIRINPQDFKIRAPHIGITQGALATLTEINEYLEKNL